MKALHELTQEEYIKHLEDYLLELNDECYMRCAQCHRVEDTYSLMTSVRAGADIVRVCDTCLLAWERAENRAQEIAASDEKDYRAAKGNR